MFMRDKEKRYCKGYAVCFVLYLTCVCGFVHREKKAFNWMSLRWVLAKEGEREEGLIIDGCLFIFISKLLLY
jgi:hypothetical protein